MKKHFVFIIPAVALFLLLTFSFVVGVRVYEIHKTHYISFTRFNDGADISKIDVADFELRDELFGIKDKNVIKDIVCTLSEIPLIYLDDTMNSLSDTAIEMYVYDGYGKYSMSVSFNSLNQVQCSDNMIIYEPVENNVRLIDTMRSFYAENFNLGGDL